MLITGAIQNFHVANRWQLQWYAIAAMLIAPMLCVWLGDRLTRQRR